MFYFKDANQITVYFKDGSSASWDSSDSEYKRIAQLAKEENFIAIKVLKDPVKGILNSDSVSLKEEGISVKTGDQEVTISPEGKLSKLIELLKQRGIVETEIDKVLPFLKNISENKYINATTEIYDYLTKLDFEITEDGCILAYKNVNEDLSSCFDNKTVHKIGEYTETDDFDTDRSAHCSRGLHFCSRNYLKDYRGAKTIIVKVNPKDIVSIPLDHNFEKGRCCRYYVVGILGKNGELETTNVDAMDSSVKTVKTEERKQKDVEKSQYKNRVEETYSLMQEYQDKQKVAEIMNIAVSSVTRNLYKYKASHRED